MPQLERQRQPLHHLTACALLAAALPLQAADTAPPAKPRATAPATSPAVDPLAAARARIADKHWSAAVDSLMMVRDDNSADWHNLMGYAMRNLPAADYPVAEYHYDQALRINPAHRGALEYSGELYLLTGRRAKAEERLAALAKLCPAGCEELADLKAALAKARP